jgi:ribosomal-protein-alanine N-acetyltransferase
MKIDISTERLHIRSIQVSDAPFMLRLLNSPGWLTFIGDKKIRLLADCEKYVESVKDDENIIYSIVYLKDGPAIGVITLVIKDYLPEHDLGFAFLEEFQGKGYASEASLAVLGCDWIKAMPFVSAVVLEENDRSIHLLERLGFSFQELLPRETEELRWYRWKNHTLI